MTEKPKRRVEFKLEVSADSIDELVSYLRNLAFEIQRGTRTGVSGGYSTGAVYQTVEDESITHESWEKVLNEYLDTLDEDKKEQRPAHSELDREKDSE